MLMIAGLPGSDLPRLCHGYLAPSPPPGQPRLQAPTPPTLGVVWWALSIV